MVLGAELYTEVKKVSEEGDVVGEQGNVIRLADGGDMGPGNRHTEVGVLGRVEVLSTVSNVELPGGNAPLLEPYLIVDRSKNLPIPFKESLSVGEAVVEVEELVSCGANDMELPDNELSHC